MDAIELAMKEFLIESHENLDQLDRDLVTLEQDPTARETLDSVFRTIHTLKGNSACFEFMNLESVTRIGENLLRRVRDGETRLHPEMTSGLLALVDAVRQMLASSEATGDEGEGDYTELIELLTRLHKSEPAAEAPAAPATE